MDEAGDSTFPNWPELRRLFAYDELVGKVLQGRYEVVRRLGAGGMGVVFLARHIHLDKLFALKIISARFLDEPEIGRRFLLEARAASKIDHPNVVGITDFGPPEEGPAFFVMEYLEGEDLARTLAREGPLPWPRALHIVAQIARALAAAHARGVVHRDIKPQNCLRVARDGDPDFIKVLDFGLAKVLSGTAKSTWTVGGSPGYIAPEIYRGGKTDHRVDLFAVGVVLHALLLGRLPSQAPSDVELPAGAAVLQPSDLPPPLLAVIRRATDEDPERRYPTAEALLAALADARAALARTNKHVSSDMSLETSSSTRRRGLWVAASAVGALAIIVAAAGARGDGAEAPGELAAPREGPLAVPPVSGAGPAPAAPTPDGPLDRDAPAPAPAADPAPPLAGAEPPADPVGPDATSGQVLSDMPDRAGSRRPVDPPRQPVRPLAAFDEGAARALLLRHADDVRACKAGSSFRNIAATVRITGTVTVTARGRATLALPPGYDVTPCLERLVAGLRFRASTGGGAFAYTFLL